MKIPCIDTTGGKVPRLVVAQYRTVAGQKIPALGTNQARSNNGYKGGVLSPPFWKITLNSPPSFYSSIASLCETVVHEIHLDGYYHTPWPIHAASDPPKWLEVMVDNRFYLSVEDWDIAEAERAIYENYTPYRAPPNRTPVPEEIGTGRNPDYVTSVDCGDIYTLDIANVGLNNYGDTITFEKGTAEYTPLGLRVITNNGFEPYEIYTQTDNVQYKMTAMWHSSYTVTQYPTPLNTTDIDVNVYTLVCGELHSVDDVITFEGGGTARVTEITSVNETTGIIVAVEIVDEAGFITSGNEAQVNQTDTDGEGTDATVSITFTGLLHYDIVDGGTGFVVGDRTFFYVDSVTVVIDVSQVDANGTIEAFTLVHDGGLPLGETHDMDLTYGDGVGFQIYAHPVVAITPVPLLEIIGSVLHTTECGTNYQLGDIVEFGDARGVITDLYGHDKAGNLWWAVLGHQWDEWKFYGSIRAIFMTDVSGLEPDGVYTATGVDGGNELEIYLGCEDYPGADWPGSGEGTGAEIRANADCTVDRVGWPSYNAGIRSMKWSDYGSTPVTVGNMQIQVQLTIPRASDRYRANNPGSWYPEQLYYIVWGMEVEHEMWPHVMHLDSLSLPFIGIADHWSGKVYPTGWMPYADWSGTTVTLTRVHKPSDNYVGRPFH